MGAQQAVRSAGPQQADLEFVSSSGASNITAGVVPATVARASDGGRDLLGESVDMDEPRSRLRSATMNTVLIAVLQRDGDAGKKTQPEAAAPRNSGKA